MYKTSSDKRFIKVKKEIRQAYLDLVIEKGYQQVSIADIARKADINRMTFYSHYDIVEDIMAEFVDDMEKEIKEVFATAAPVTVGDMFEILNELMYREIDFFRYVSKHPNCAIFRESYKQCISRIVKDTLFRNVDCSDTEKLILSDLASVTIAYSYFNWLSGSYGDATLEEVLNIAKQHLIKEYELK